MKNQIEEKIKKMFENHPNIDELHVTSDAQGFTNVNAAESHAGVLIDKKVLKCKRADFVGSAKNKDGKEIEFKAVLSLSIGNLKPVIGGIKTLEELEALKFAETHDQKRKGVFELIEAREKELIDALDVDADDVTGDATEGAGTGDTTGANKTE